MEAMKLEIKNPETGEWMEMVCAPHYFISINRPLRYKRYDWERKTLNMIATLKRKRK